MQMQMQMQDAAEEAESQEGWAFARRALHSSQLA
jgi:hypothetical protein